MDELRKQGFDVVRAEDLGNTGLDDKQQLLITIELQRTLITDDKNTFLKDSKATSFEHYGIIILSNQINTNIARATAHSVIDKYLNKYACDEWEKLVVYL